MSNKIIIVKPENCVGCNACVRNCPAPEANITKKLEDGRFVTTVKDDMCIACGECVKTCEHGARDYIDDTKEVMSVLGNQRMAVIVAPAIKAALHDRWKSVLNWFKERNCLIFDVSFGADICTWGHLRAIQQKRIGNVLTQPCAAIVRYIETYQPSLIKNLSPVHSPMLCTAIYIKKYLGINDKIIALSPCVAKKNEFEETALVDYNVTFKKLMEYFDINGVNIPLDSGNDYAYEFEYAQGQYGSIYPRIGGLRDNLQLHDPNIIITTSEGVHKVYPELDMYSELPEIKRPEVFDILSCEHGCNVGVGTGSKRTIFDNMDTMKKVEDDAKKRRKTAGAFFVRGGEDKLFKKFDSELNLNDFLRSYVSRGKSVQPTRDELAPVFKELGKLTEAEQHYDCHACGRRSCVEMATAIYRGLDVPENCIVHAKAVLAEEHQKAIEQKERIQKKLTEYKQILDSLIGEIDKATFASNASSKLASNVKLTITAIEGLSSQITDALNKSDFLAGSEVESLKQAFGLINDAFNKVEKNVDLTDENNQKTIDYLTNAKKTVEQIKETLVFD